MTIALPGVLGNGPMGHAPQVLVASILVTSHIRIPDLTTLLAAAWIALHGQPSRWARLLRWAAYPLLLVPSFLSLPNQLATILSGALVGIEILWLATPYPSPKGSRAQTQPVAA